MAQFVILIYENEAEYESQPPEFWHFELERHAAFRERVGDLGGQVLAVTALQPSPTAKTVRRRVITDGPLAEGREALLGYYLIEAKDLEHAIEISLECPTPFGAVEIRPVRELTG